MNRRRARKPETVSIERVAQAFSGGFEWFELCGAARPTSARIWRRRDGGITIRAAAVTEHGHKVSYTVKVSRG